MITGVEYDDAFTLFDFLFQTAKPGHYLDGDLEIYIKLLWGSIKLWCPVVLKQVGVLLLHKRKQTPQFDEFKEVMGKDERALKWMVGAVASAIVQVRLRMDDDVVNLCKFYKSTRIMLKEELAKYGRGWEEYAM